jgi:anti-sigma regulatory factor (Ser/Thr protein kinase)
MEDLSLHILDVAENSVTAGATLIEIRVEEEPQDDLLSIEISDNGRGMEAKTAAAALDPFMTTKAHKRVGLGLPLFAQSAREADGDLRIESSPGQGTRVIATMKYHHIDRKPLGDLTETMMVLVMGSPQVEVRFIHEFGGRQFVFTTWDFKERLKDEAASPARVIRALRTVLHNGETALKS